MIIIRQTLCPSAVSSARTLKLRLRTMSKVSASSSAKSALPEPVPVIMLGSNPQIAEAISQGISKTANVIAITPEIEDLKVLLQRLRPRPKGILIGGAFTDEQAALAKELGNSFGATTFVRVTPGTSMT